MTRSALPITLLLAIGAASAQDLARKAPPEVDDALKTRVSQFYQHFQRGEFRQAEELLDPPSRELFYNAKKNRIIDFRIQNVDYKEDYRNAGVLVVCKMIVNMMGHKPLEMPLTSDWRFADGEWWMHLEAPRQPPGADAESPAGPMTFSKEMPPPGSTFGVKETPVPRPTLESLKTMYEISTDTLTFPKDAAEPVSRSMTVKNASIGKLSVEYLEEPLQGIEVTIEGAEMKAGGEATITITYDPNLEKPLTGRVPVSFEVMPISQVFNVFLDF
jgi:hypothetical protein